MNRSPGFAELREVLAKSSDLRSLVIQHLLEATDSQNDFTFWFRCVHEILPSALGKDATKGLLAFLEASDPIAFLEQEALSAEDKAFFVLLHHLIEPRVRAMVNRTAGRLGLDSVRTGVNHPRKDVVEIHLGVLRDDGRSFYMKLDEKEILELTLYMLQVLFQVSEATGLKGHQDRFNELRSVFDRLVQSVWPKTDS